MALYNFIGPAAANVAPVATAMSRPAPQLAGNLALTGTITDSDGTVATGTWTLVSGPDNPTPSVSTSGLGTSSATIGATFDAVAGVYVWRLSGTDNAGTASNNSTVQIDVYPASGTNVKPASRTGGTATVVGAGSAIAAVTDNLDTSYTESVSDPTNSDETWRWCPFGPVNNVVFNIRCVNSGTPDITVTVTVFQEDGVTQIYETSFTAPTTISTVEVTVDSTGMAAIPTLTNRRALITRIRANA